LTEESLYVILLKEKEYVRRICLSNKGTGKEDEQIKGVSLTWNRKRKELRDWRKR